MDVVRSNTLSRVLDIPEILELIFSFLDQESISSSVTVCKRWSDLALNSLWRDIPEPRRLFCLLAPLRNHPASDVWVFSRTPDIDDWSRFTRYARRVRTLLLDERHRPTVDETRKPIICKDVFDEMNQSRISLNILPNLRSLTWATDSSERMRLSRLFQHENITDFAVYLHQTAEYPLSKFFKEVLLRMPNLVNLDLRFRVPAREIETELLELFGGLTKLKRVVLPIYTITSRITQELSKQQHLHTIQFEFKEAQGHGDMTDVLRWSPQLEEGAFPALSDLSLSANLSDVTSFLTSKFAPNLTCLYIQLLSAPPLETVSAFLTALSEDCQLLSHLFLDFFTSATIAPTPQHYGRLNWNTLRPLLLCGNLVSFEIRWDQSLDISQDDIEEMASKWPSLEILLLNCEPMDNSIPPVLDLRALLPFARHCPKLTELGLYLNASRPHDVPRLDATTKVFTRLKRLSVGLSSIADAGQTALFLSQLCPLGCEVIPGVTWPDAFGVVETAANTETLDRLQREAAENFAGWTEVAKMLPLLTKLRIEERATREAVEKEVEDLRIRCKLLMERADVKVDPDGSCVPF